MAAPGKSGPLAAPGTSGNLRQSSVLAPAGSGNLRMPTGKIVQLSVEDSAEAKKRGEGALSVSDPAVHSTPMRTRSRGDTVLNRAISTLTAEQVPDKDKGKGVGGRSRRVSNHPSTLRKKPEDILNASHRDGPPPESAPFARGHSGMTQVTGVDSHESRDTLSIGRRASRPAPPTPQAVEEELAELRTQLEAKEKHEVVDAAVMRARQLKAAEAASQLAKHRAAEAERELRRLRHVERQFRREMQVRSHASRIHAINDTLRRLLLEGASPQRRAAVLEAEQQVGELSDALDERDEQIAALEREVASLRSVQAEAMRSFDGGRAGELAAAKAHADFLEAQVNQLREENRVIGGEVLARLEQRIAPRADSAAVGGDFALRVVREVEALREQLKQEQQRREEAEVLVGSLLIKVAPPQEEEDSPTVPPGGVTPHSYPAVTSPRTALRSAPESSRWSPAPGAAAVRRGGSTIPGGYRMAV
eukprot:TRINITY_DN66527_c0_g1_i1.p1 TRINITY_DN66527_c0_g1~~TRINITY_DN66527_c0_g1_i1.p1  ORF type:complete len:476 (+),score=163.96 TRINITY_DN66527_c0_g1_i1:86-1513(+)